MLHLLARRAVYVILSRMNGKESRGPPTRIRRQEELRDIRAHASDATRIVTLQQRHKSELAFARKESISLREQLEKFKQVRARAR